MPDPSDLLLLSGYESLLSLWISPRFPHMLILLSGPLFLAPGPVLSYQTEVAVVPGFLPSICLVLGSADHRWTLKIWGFDLLTLQSLRSSGLHIYHHMDLQQWEEGVKR